MERVELLTVGDSFQIGSFVVVHPDFSVPNGRRTSRTESVLVVSPNGEKREAAAQFDLSHFKFSEPSVSIDRRWRVVLSLLGCTKDQVPVGSTILVSQEMRDALLGIRPG
jgi:hypothetical protein